MNSAEEKKQEVIASKVNERVQYPNKNSNGAFGRQNGLRRYNRGRWNGVNRGWNQRQFRGKGRRFFNGGRPAPFFNRRWNNYGYGRNNNSRGPTNKNQVFNFLSAVSSKEIEPSKLAKAEAISAQLLALQRPIKPKNAFGHFIADAKKKDPKTPFETIRKDWDAIPENDKKALLEKNWFEFNEFKGKLKDYNKTRGELEKELRLLQGLLPNSRLNWRITGFDIHWKEVESKVVSDFPKATAYELDQKHRSMWKTLTEKEKQVYILQSKIEIEKAAHDLKLINYSSMIQVLKDEIESGRKAQEAAAKAK
jgi:hypothetical protein